MAELWKELHLRALNFNGKDDVEFLKGFARRIPRFTTGCSCKEHWKLFVQTNPPKFGPEEYFNWTVDAHNFINQKVGKPTFTKEQAREYYKNLSK